MWNEHMQMLQNRHIIFLFIKIYNNWKIDISFSPICAENWHEVSHDSGTNINIFQWKDKNGKVVLSGKVVCKLYTYTHIIYKIYKVFYIYTCIKYMKYYYFIKKLYKQFYNAERACLVCSILRIQRLNESVYVRETLLIKNNYS